MLKSIVKWQNAVKSYYYQRKFGICFKHLWFSFVHLCIYCMSQWPSDPTVLSSLHLLWQAGAGGAAPRGPRGEEAAAQEPKGVWGQVPAAERKVRRKTCQQKTFVFPCGSALNHGSLFVFAVPVETCRKRTAPRWQRSTTNTSTSRPNWGCWKSSSANETPASLSEEEFKLGTVRWGGEWRTDRGWRGGCRHCCLWLSGQRNVLVNPSLPTAAGSSCGAAATDSTRQLLLTAEVPLRPDRTFHRNTLYTQAETHTTCNHNLSDRHLFMLLRFLSLLMFCFVLFCFFRMKVLFFTLCHRSLKEMSK